MKAPFSAGWEALGHRLAPAFTGPTYVIFLHPAAGWVPCQSRPTATNLVGTIGSLLPGHTARHWTVPYYQKLWTEYKRRRNLKGVVKTLFSSPFADFASTEKRDFTAFLVWSGVFPNPYQTRGVQESTRTHEFHRIRPVTLPKSGKSCV